MNTSTTPLPDSAKIRTPETSGPSGTVSVREDRKPSRKNTAVSLLGKRSRPGSVIKARSSRQIRNRATAGLPSMELAPAVAASQEGMRLLLSRSTTLMSSRPARAGRSARGRWLNSPASTRVARTRS